MKKNPNAIKQNLRQAIKVANKIFIQRPLSKPLYEKVWSVPSREMNPVERGGFFMFPVTKQDVTSELDPWLETDMNDLENNNGFQVAWMYTGNSRKLLKITFD